MAHWEHKIFERGSESYILHSNRYEAIVFFRSTEVIHTSSMRSAYEKGYRWQYAGEIRNIKNRNTVFNENYYGYYTKTRKEAEDGVIQMKRILEREIDKLENEQKTYRGRI